MARFLVPALALLAVAAALWSWFALSPAQPPGVAAPRAEHAARADVVSETPGDPGSSAAERRTVVQLDAVQEAPSSQPAAIDVLVERIDKGPAVEGAEVVARGSQGSERIEPRGRTDASGKCRLEHPASFVAESVSVRPTATTTAETVWLDRAWVGAGRELPVTLLVSGGGTLVGRVVDEDGQPFAGARVLGWCANRFEPPPDRETQSDELGRFELAQLGSSFTVVAASSGLACAQGLRGRLAPGARAEGELELILRPLTHLRGRVVGARDAPVAAHVKLLEAGLGSGNDRTNAIGVDRFRPVQGEATCDALGAFELGPIPSGAWRVEVQHPDYHPWRGTTPDDVSREWIIRLEAGCGVRGSVADRDGAPLAGAKVALRASEGPWREARSAADGSFAVRGIDCGAGALLMVSAPGHAPWFREGLELSDGIDPFVDVRLEPGLPLAGRIVERNGTPVAGARLELEGDRAYARDYDADEPATLEYLFDRGRTCSDEDGRFRFEDLYQGRFTVLAFLPGAERLHQDAVAFAGDEAVAIVVDRAAIERVVLAGRVVDRSTGAPLRSFMIMPMVWTSDGEAMGSGVSVTDGEGRFRLPGIDPGRIALRVSAPGYAAWTEAPRELEAGTHSYDVRLAKMRIVGVSLLDLAGEPIRGSASLRFQRLDGGPVEIQHGSMSRSRIPLGDAGTKAMQLPAEPLQVAFDLLDGEPERVFDIDLERDPSEMFEFRIGVAEEKPVAVQCLLVSATADFDASGLEERIRGNQGSIELPDCAPPRVRVEFRARNARGIDLVAGVLEPTADGFEQTWTIPSGASTGGTTPYAWIDVALTDRATQLVITAKGHAQQALALNPSAGNAGLPRILVLRRK